MLIVCVITGHRPGDYLPRMTHRRKPKLAAGGKPATRNHAKSPHAAAPHGIHLSGLRHPARPGRGCRSGSSGRPPHEDAGALLMRVQQPRHVTCRLRPLIVQPFTSRQGDLGWRRRRPLPMGEPMTLTFPAWGPLALGHVELDLLAFLQAAVPPPVIALKCTNTSGPPCRDESEPFSGLNHFTVPRFVDLLGCACRGPAMARGARSAACFGQPVSGRIPRGVESH